MHAFLAKFIVIFIASATLLASAPAHTQADPTRPIKIVVPFAPGGGSDFIARFIAQRLGTALGQPVIVDNRPGAGVTVGIDVGLASPADGYTIIQLSQGPMVVVANPGFAPKTAKDIIAAAKARPGEVTFASAGQGSITHMGGEFFASMAGIKINHIPYKGSGPAMTDTIGGQTNLFFATTASALPQIAGGKLKAIAVTTSTRRPALPDVPTVAKSGLPGYDVTIWHGLIGPKGMPKEAVARLSSESNKLLQLKDTAEQLQKDGVFPAGGTPEQFSAQIRKELSFWKKTDGRRKH